MRGKKEFLVRKRGYVRSMGYLRCATGRRFAVMGFSQGQLCRRDVSLGMGKIKSCSLGSLEEVGFLGGLAWKAFILDFPIPGK